MQNLTEKVVKGSFWRVSSSFLNRLGTFILTILLARFLFPENFGLYSLTMSLAYIFMTFADLGLNKTLIRYFSSNIKNEEQAAAHFQYIFKLKFILSLLVSILLLLTAYPLAFYVYKCPSLFMPLIMASLFILSFLFIDFLSALFYPLNKVHYVAIKELLFQTTRIVLVVLVFFLLTSTYHILGIFAGLILTNLVIILILLIWIKKLVPHIFKKPNVKIDKKRLIKFLGFMTIASISGMLFTSTDMIMLGFFVSLSYVGFYKIAFTLIFGIISLFTHFSLVLLPIFTNLKEKKLKIVLNKVLRFILIFSIPTMFGLLVLGKYFVKVLYGDDYIKASSPLFFLSFLLLFWVFISIVSVFFYSKGHPKYVAKAQATVFLLNIILNYILISILVKVSELWAIKAAAITTLFCFFIYGSYLFLIIKKKFNVYIDKMIFVKPIFAGIIMFISLYAINLFLITKMNLLIGISEILLGALVYFSIMFIIKGFGKKDLNIFKKIPILKWKQE